MELHFRKLNFKWVSLTTSTLTGADTFSVWYSWFCWWSFNAVTNDRYSSCILSIYIKLFPIDLKRFVWKLPESEKKAISPLVGQMIQAFWVSLNRLAVDRPAQVSAKYETHSWNIYRNEPFHFKVGVHSSWDSAQQCGLYWENMSFFFTELFLLYYHYYLARAWWSNNCC